MLFTHNYFFLINTLSLFCWKIISYYDHVISENKAVLHSKLDCRPLSSGIRLQHMRPAIAHAKKSTTCLIIKASRCAADRMSKTTIFIFQFL